MPFTPKVLLFLPCIMISKSPRAVTTGLPQATKNEAIAYNISTASKPVELAFSHALTALTFAVDAEMIPGKVKRITIKGVNGQGDYDFAPILVRFERFLVVSSIVSRSTFDPLSFGFRHILVRFSIGLR